MPFVHVSSSVARADVDSIATKRAIAEAAAAALERPLSHVVVKLDLDQDMFANESEEVMSACSPLVLDATSRA
jgi:hypothetical protein